MFWLTRCTIGFRNLPAIETKIKKKCPDIPAVYSYRGKPKTDFWWGEQKGAAEGRSKMLVQMGLPPAVHCKKGRKNFSRRSKK
jgi:hypothetical protein